MKKLYATIVATVVLCSSASAQNIVPPTIAAKSWVLLDATSGQVLASQEPNMRIEPASLAKLMTTYLAFEAIHNKKLDPNQMITVSVAAWKVEGDSSKMFIEPRVPVSVNDLLYGLIVQSGNDAAVALSEAVAGTEETFVGMMNSEAQRMGMKESHFSNPHGLPSPETYTTAQDLATLATHLANDFPDLYKIFATKSFTYNKITQPNRNRLLWLDPTVDGLKTGHTQAAGFCLIATAKRSIANGDRRLISVVLGTVSDQVRTQESQKLLNWGFQNFDTVKLFTKGQPVATPEIWKGTQNTVKIGFNHDVYVTVPRGMADKIQSVIQRKDPLVAPLQENAQIGTMKLTADGKPMSELPIVALEQVSQASVFGRAWDSVRLLFK